MIQSQQQLSDEQLQQIELNRIRAKELLLRKRQLNQSNTNNNNVSFNNINPYVDDPSGDLICSTSAERLQPEKKAKPNTDGDNDTMITHCEYVSEDGQACRNTVLVELMRDTFGERICSHCKPISSDYELVNRSDAMAHYLVPDDALKFFRFTTKHNPRNPGWQPMKLYLRKHLRTHAEQRFGSEEGLQEELKLRGEKKFQRDLQRMQSEFEQKSVSFADRLDSAAATCRSACDLERDPSSFSNARDSRNKPNKPEENSNAAAMTESLVAAKVSKSMKAVRKSRYGQSKVLQDIADCINGSG